MTGLFERITLGFETGTDVYIVLGGGELHTKLVHYICLHLPDDAEFVDINKTGNKV